MTRLYFLPRYAELSWNVADCGLLTEHHMYSVCGAESGRVGSVETVRQGSGVLVHGRFSLVLLGSEFVQVRCCWGDYGKNSSMELTVI